MNFESASNFMGKNHQGVISTRRPNGLLHSSIVVCGVYDAKAVFVSVYPRSQKIANLRRDPVCTVLTVTPDWRQYLVIEGKAQLFDYQNTKTKNMRQLFRDAYVACSDRDHPNWEEYDQAMVWQEGVVVLVPPEKVYGSMI